MKRSPIRRKTPLKRTPIKRKAPKPSKNPPRFDHCERCGTWQWVEGHHRRLKSQGGTDDPANIAMLCRLCHSAVHSFTKQATIDGWIIQTNPKPDLRK